MFNIEEELKKLPGKPGVYIMRNSDDTVIYVGKAVVLKNRVRQYFQQSARHAPKVVAMVAQIVRFEYIVTDTEVEALILECNLIKKYRPYFNILLKDDKSYPYIKITLTEAYPRIVMTRRLERDGSRYFGPFTNVGSVRENLDVIKRLFPVKTCDRKFPRDIGKERPCLNYFIFKCIGPCTGNISQEEYQSVIYDVVRFLEGKNEDIQKKLEKQMFEASERMEFERAAALRDKVRALASLTEKQKVLSAREENRDIIAFAKGHADAAVQVFFVRNGRLIGREHFVLEGAAGAEDGQLMSDFLMQFYDKAAEIPGEILLSHAPDDIQVLNDWLTLKRGGKSTVVIPSRGDKKQLVEMVFENAEIALKNFHERVTNSTELADEAISKLGQTLGLKSPPMRIEAYDISNTGASGLVGAMVVFRNGKADNQSYKRFKIKTVSGTDDYASMQEVLFRRLRRAKNPESSERTGFEELPDLILADGGLGHVHAVEAVLKELGMSVPVAGMAKDDHHKTERLVISDGTEYRLQKDPVLWRLISSIQDEVHRFAISYHQHLRAKQTVESELDQIQGIGPKRRKLLIKAFGSVKRIRQAELDDLRSVPGITQSVAETVYQYFHK